MSEEDEKSVKIDVEEDDDDDVEEKETSDQENEDGDTDSVDSSSKTAPPSATSKRSAISRKGSGKSQKSVVWSTGASSEKELLDDEQPEKEKGSVLQIISGRLGHVKYIKFTAFI